MLIKLEHEKTGGITKVDDFEVVNSLKSKEISGENKVEVIDEDIKIISGISEYEVEGVKYQINNNFVLNNNVYVNNTNIFNTTIDQKGKITITDPAFSFEMYLDEDKILSAGANHQNNSLFYLDIMETQDLEYRLNNNYVSVINTFKSYNFSSIDFNIFSNELDIEYDKTNKCLNLLHKGETAIYKIDEFSILNQYNEVMDGLNIELKDYNKLSFSFDSNVKPIYLCFNIHKVSKPIVSISNTCNDKFVYSDFTKLILGHKRGLSYNLDISCDTEEIINVMSNYLLDDYKVQLILPYVQGIRAENSLGFNAYYQENLLQTSKYLDNSNLITIDITNEIAKQIDNYKKGFSIYDLKISIESIKDINRTIYDDYIEVYGFLENNLINKPYILITRDNEFKMYDGTPELEINNLRSGKLAFNLHHKKFKHRVDLGNVRSKNLSVPVSLLYDERISNINNHVGLGFKLNLNQRLERAIFSSKLLSSKEIKYYDANNNCHMLYEKWFYEQNNVRHYIIKDKVYIGSDQKLKYKNEDGTEFDVEYEVVSDNNLRFISLKDQYTYHSKDDMKCNKKYYMLLENHTKLELEFNNGFVRVPHFYSLVSASANVSINDLVPESRAGNTPYTTLDSINKSTINYVKCYKYENGKYYDIYSNELGVEYIDSPILYENEKYYVRGLSKKHIIHLDDNDSTFYSKFDDSYKINVLIDKEYYLDKSVKLTDINQTEDLANVENQIIETENYINSLKEQAKQISDNVISYENEYYHYDIMNGIEKMLNSLREEINNTSESETYTEEIQTLIDSYNELSEKYKLDKYNYDMKNLHNNICDLNNQLRESLNTLTTYEIKLQNLYEIKENLIKSLKNEVQDVILDEEGNHLGFDYFGKLVNIVDAFENEISINYYNDRIVSIIGKDEKIYLKYNDKDLVETLTNNDGIEYKFYYEDNKLIKISYFGDRNEVDQMLFEYNDNNILNVITDASGLKVRFTNLDNNMYFINQYSYVSSFTTENINMQNNIINIKDYLIEYENNKITVKDNIKNTLNLYYLDKKGRLIYSYYNDLDKRNSLDNLDIEKWDYYLYEDKDLKYNVLLEEKNKLISLGSYAMDSFSVCGDIYLNDENNIYNINLSHRRMLLGLVLNNLENYDMLNYNVSVSVKVYDKNANIKTSNYTYENSSYENIIVPIIVTENDVYIEYMFTFEDDISTFDFGSLHVYEATGNIYTYNEEGIVIKSENEEEEITYADFILKKPTKIIKVDSLGEEHITYQKYNEQGLMTYLENSDGICLENYYDEKGNILEKRTYNKNNSSVGEIIRYKYDEKGLLVTEDDNKKVIYLPNNFVSKIETKSGSVTCYGRDFNTKNVLEITHSSVNGEVTNTQNQKYKFGYVTECSHNGCTYEYVLDPLGRKKEVKIDGTLTYKFDYDDSFTETIESVEIYHGTKTTFINAISNRYISEYKYKDGRIAIKEYGQNLDSECIQDYYVKYIYDAKDRLIKVEEIYPENGGTGSTIESEYGYNDLINFKKYNVTDKYVKETYTYDDLDRVTFIKQDVYDEGVEYTYSYDDEDRITNVSTNFSINSDSTYDSQDRISIRKTLGTNCNIEEEFDYVTKSDNVTNLVNNHIVRINNEEIKINDYTYDDNGNIINVYNGYNTDYVYDKLGRLIRENNEELDKSITYKYDKAGNIIQKQTSDYTLETKLTNTLKDNYIYSGTSWKDKLIKFNDKTFEYDNLGRPVKIGDNVLTWNSKGKLASYGNILFDYDINGYRKSKTVNGVVTKYYTFDNRIVREETNGSYITYIYNVDRLIGFCYNGISYIYERNILGDIIGIYNANTKEKVATYAYTGYGEHVVHNYTSNNIGDINPFRYRGYYYDVETNLFLVSSRYYSPELCRWISPDDIEYLDPESVNGLNLYCYCFNNPIMYVDPDGHMPEWLDWNWDQFKRGLITIGIAAVAVATIAVVSVVTFGSATPVLIGAAIGAGVSAGVSAGGQYLTTGSINIGQVLTDMSVGAVSGAFGGTALGHGGMFLSGFGTGFAGSIAEDLVKTGSIADVRLGAAIWSGFLGGALSGITKGAQNKQFARLSKFNNRIKVCKSKGITNSYFTKAVKKSSALVRSANMAVIKSIPQTIGSTIIDFYL